MIIFEKRLDGLRKANSKILTYLDPVWTTNNAARGILYKMYDVGIALKMWTVLEKWKSNVGIKCYSATVLCDINP